MMSHIEYPSYPESVPLQSVEQNAMPLSHQMATDKAAIEDGAQDTRPSESMESTKVPPDDGEMLVASHSNEEVDGEDQRVDSGGMDIENVESKMEE